MERNVRTDPGAHLMEVYVDWRDESAALEDAYRRWSTAPEHDRALAFAAYKAALDREEQASIVYRDQLRQISARSLDPPVRASSLSFPLSVDQAMY